MTKPRVYYRDNHWFVLYTSEDGPQHYGPCQSHRGALTVAVYLASFRPFPPTINYRPLFEGPQ